MPCGNRNLLTADELRGFEAGIAAEFEAGRIPAPVHLSGGNEEELIRIFQRIHPQDWVFSTWRSHYHALLHGIPREKLRAMILAGHSMNVMSVEHRFFTSAIVGGILPIAVGVACALKRRDSPCKVWCFVGDMAASAGIAQESLRYAGGHALPITFIIEDNGLSCDTPTGETWGDHIAAPEIYGYRRCYPHMNTGKWVDFPQQPR